MKNDRTRKLKEIFEEHGGVVKSSVLRANKFYSRDIARLVSDGYLAKIKTGYYAWLTDSEIRDIALASSVIKSSVICLLSAAQYYDLITVNPTAVDVAVLAGGTPPVLPDYPPIRLHRYNRSHFDLGVVQIIVNEIPIRIYNTERTICDLFRMRNLYGMDIALEALKSYMSLKGVNIQRLYGYAEKLRIKTVITPYVEALL